MDTVSFLNYYSSSFARFSWIMLLQSSVLILILLGLDLLLRQKVRAVFRYCLWMLLLVKLVLPVGLALPCSPAYWASNLLPEAEFVDDSSASIVQTDLIPATVSTDESVLYPPVTEMSATGPATIQPPTDASANTAIQQPQVSISWQSFVGLGWLVAVLIMIGLLIQRVFFVSSLIRQSTPANENLLSQLNRCASKMNMRQGMDLRISPNATSPSVCGLIRPVILIPDNLTDHLNKRQMDAILMHELAHIKRGDLWVNLVQALLQIAYFYNPLLWVANAVIRRTREQAVDEMVLVAMDEHAEEYPETLLNVSKLVWSKPMLSLRLIGVVESKSALTSRIKHILSRPFPKSARIGLVGLASIFIAAAVLLPMAKGEWEKEISNPVRLDENDKPIVTHTLYIQGQPEQPVYQLENKTYNSAEEVVAHIGELMKQKPFPHIRAHTTSQFQRQQEPIERLGRLCREIGFINMEYKYDLEPAANNFTAALPNGMTVELLGVCEHPSEGEKWWSLDGTELESRPYDKFKILASPNEKEQAKEMAIRLLADEELVNQASVKWKIPQSSSSSGNVDSRDEQGNQILHTRVVAFTCDSDLDSLSFQLGIAAGKWKDQAFSNGAGHTNMSDGDLSVAFAPPMPVKGNTRITVSWKTVERDFRVVAIDKDSNLHTARRSTGGGSADLSSYTYTFKMSPDQIQTYKLQSRNYEWLTFKNVSLRPGEKTEVEIETQSSVTSPRPSKGTAKEIQAQIEILEHAKAGEREKWFAAVKVLVDIGSPAVPALSEAIRKTDSPRAQSTMALTLRAIGDSQAVPALINALEKSGFSSDYGVGKPDTELAKFIHQYQMDPSRNSIGLGRPVREITIALEKLTGHTEGHDHFHAYDENGKRLGSHTVTPELRDRQREHRRQVAQRWRNWWQGRQKSNAHEGGVIASREGSVLEFYILPEPGKEDWDGLTSDDVARYRKSFQTEGPWVGAIRGDSYQWALIDDDLQDDGLIVETYQGQRYAERFEGKRFVLHAARAAYAMRPDETWGLKKVNADSDSNGRPAIHVTFDPAGTEEMHTLTENNLQRRLAVLVDGKVVTAPRIMAVLSKQAVITGSFTKDETEEIVAKLKKGMPPVTFEMVTLPTMSGAIKVEIPNLDLKQVMLDIQANKLVEITGIDDDESFIKFLGKTTQPVVFYDDGSHGTLAFHRAQVTNYPAEQVDGLSVIKFEYTGLPIEFDIETQDYKKYRVKVLSANRNQCSVEYFPHDEALNPGGKTEGKVETTTSRLL